MPGEIETIGYEVHAGGNKAARDTHDKLIAEKVAKLTCYWGMSAFGGKADIDLTPRDVRF